MKKADKYIRQELSKSDREVPISVKNKIEETLFQLPDQEICVKRYSTCKKLAISCACFLFITLVLLPNISATYAKTLERIAVLGNIVKVVTLRNYFYSDDQHEMNINIPKIEGENEGIDFINAEVEELSKFLVQKFYDELEMFNNETHSAVYVDYKTVTNTKTWFSLKLVVNEVKGSGNTYYKYYHLNKLTGKMIILEDIVADKKFYTVVEKEIKSQMKKQMKDNPELKYWVEDSEFGEDFVSIEPNHNFYWNKDNNLVIPFDKYETAPGYMGTFEFTIDKDLIKEYLNPEIRRILFEDIR